MFIGFSFRENLGEFRIRGLQIGLYLRNISNENLGLFLLKRNPIWWKANITTRMRLMDDGLLGSVVVYNCNSILYHLHHLQKKYI